MSWQEHAACRGEDTDLFFGERGVVPQTVQFHLCALCAMCPVFDECDREARATSSVGWWAGAWRSHGRPVRSKYFPAAVDDPLLALGFTRQQAGAARGLVASMSKATWALGDLLIAVVGPARLGTEGTGRHDGSQSQLDLIAVELGVGPRFLRQVRNVATAWPPEHRRRNVSWTAHRALLGDPQRHQTLTAFVSWCREQDCRPTEERLLVWSAWRKAKAGGADLDHLLTTFRRVASTLVAFVGDHPDARPRVERAVRSAFAAWTPVSRTA